MAEVVFMELGFPIVLIDPPPVEVRGEVVPDVNMRALQQLVLELLVTKPARLTGAEVRFVRKALRLRQVEFARILNMANHSVVSQWESREDAATGMEYNTEVLLRVWLAAKVGLGARIVELLETSLKDLVAPVLGRPLSVPWRRAA